jgi:hypothetical protein
VNIAEVSSKPLRVANGGGSGHGMHELDAAGGGLQSMSGRQLNVSAVLSGERLEIFAA